MATYTDDFNTGATLSANWTTDLGGFTVGSGHPIGTGDQNLAHWSGNTFSNDQYVIGTVIGAGNYAGVGVRMSGGGGNGYVLAWQTALFRLDKWTNGSQSTLHTFSGGVSDGDTVKIEVIGTSIHVYHNGVEESGSPITDSSFSSGAPGIYTYSTGYGVDAWEGGDSETPAPTFIPKIVMF